ncbi:MAG: hypothetical protein AAGJ79_07330 [Verrucomicrobiota bacterium]
MQLFTGRRVLFAVATAMQAAVAIAAAAEGSRFIDFLNYPGCVELSNGDTTVLLGPHVGGRVLQYSFQGKDALFLDPREEKWGTPDAEKRPVASAGRFDIGPEYLIPKREALWTGEWDAEITGKFSARMTSGEDLATGVQLIREFTLDAQSSHLRCTQIIRNISEEVIRWCHWSRTFARGGGLVIVPVDEKPRRFPQSWVLYQGRGVIDFQPNDAAVVRHDRFLQINSAAARPKFGIEARKGWIAYLMPNDLLFLKHFPIFPDRSYTELAAYNVSIYYPDQLRLPAVELEPIGPENEIPPGGRASFTEDWTLLPQDFPEDPKALDLAALEQLAIAKKPTGARQPLPTNKGRPPSP